MHEPYGVDSVTLFNAPIADVIASNAGAAGALNALGMRCVGCPFAPFETVAEVASAYGLEPSDLARAIDPHSGGADQ